MSKYAFLKITAALLLIASSLYGQKKSVDEKGQTQKIERYQNWRSSSQNVTSMLARARAIKEENPGEALDIVEEALGISIAQTNEADEGRCYLLLGEINESIEEWKLALDNYQSAYSRLAGTQTKSKRKMAADPAVRHALRGLGYANMRLGNYEEALRYFEEALSVTSSQQERAEIYLNVSETHYQMGHYDSALAVLDKINHSKDAGESLDVRVQNQKAKIFANTNRVDAARNAYEQSQNTLRSNSAKAPSKQEELMLNSAKEEVIDVLHDNQQYDDEIDVRNKSIEFNLEAKNLQEVTIDKLGLSKALVAKGETSAAIRELEEAAHMADTLNNPKDQARAFLALADLYEKNSRPDQALATYKRYREAVKKIEEQNQDRLIGKSELISKQKDIEEVARDVEIFQREETIAQATVVSQRLVIYGLLLIIAIIAITSYFIYKNALASKIANQLLALKSLRSQMNPHFIFNALNSVNHFIAQNDERTANKFLSEFSRLMRLVLENSQEDFIPLVKEQEIISLYLKLEHYRFRDKFDYNITIEDDINLEAVEIPPMLVQPYIENAVWHGLRYKETRGHLTLHIGKNNSGLKVVITDDGIGRKRSSQLKTENQKRQNSTGLKNIQERLNIINKVYKVNYNIEVNDLNENGSGTSVIIHLPFRKQSN